MKRTVWAVRLYDYDDATIPRLYANEADAQWEADLTGEGDVVEVTLWDGERPPILEWFSASGYAVKVDGVWSVRSTYVAEARVEHIVRVDVSDELRAVWPPHVGTKRFGNFFRVNALTRESALEELSHAIAEYGAERDEKERQRAEEATAAPPFPGYRPIPPGADVGTAASGVFGPEHSPLFVPDDD